MAQIYIDCETYSPENIKNGHFRYAEDVEILMIAWAADDGVPEIWDAKKDKHMPSTLRDILHGDDVLIAHNAAFEQAVFSADLTGVDIDPKRWRCSLARAYAHGLPGSLDSLSTILGLPQDKKKSKEGYDLIRLFCMPPPKNAKRGRATYLTHPKEWERFKEYCKQDIVAAREVWKKLPEWNYKGFELDLWHLDQEINRRGLCIDLDLVKAAIRAVDKEQAILKERTEDLTLGDVSSATKRDQMLAHILAAYGVELPDMTASTLERRMDDPDLPPALKELLGIRLMATTSSTAKYKKVLQCVSKDGRLRGTLQWCGAARTGRDGGRLFQPQNLPRPDMKNADIELGIEALKNDCADILYPNVMRVASNAIRGLIIAPPGKKLLIADLSNIEGRYAAWSGDEKWKLQAFRDYDTIIGYEDGKPVRKGHDLYKLAYAKTFGIKPEDVTKKQRNEVGKTLELAMGFAGGVGAFVTFATAFNVDLDKLAVEGRVSIPDDVYKEAEEFYEWLMKQKSSIAHSLSKDVFCACDSFKRMWRRAHPGITAMWGNLEDAVREAILNSGAVYTAGRARVRRSGNWLRIQMPSGRSLSYPHPRVDDKGQISFMGVDQYTRKWSRIFTHKGKIFENWVQGGARDIFMAGVVNASKAGYDCVGRIHDEQIAEVPDTPEYTVGKLCALMTENIEWSPGMPLAATGFETHRYAKED